MTPSRLRHGQSRVGITTSEYRIWCHIKSRCENPNSHVFNLYGGRGIKVCKRWNDFINFYADMGPRPSKNHSIDRIDSNGNYEISNCRWSTSKQQQRNRRNNRVFTLHARIQKGASIEQAMNPGYVGYKTLPATIERLQ